MLDFGSGTGTDALGFAAQGRRVLAYDPSDGMLGKLRERCAAAALNGRIVAVGGDIANLDDALLQFGPIQAVVSNFAVINLLPELSDFSTLVMRRMPTVRIVILGVQNPFYLPDLGNVWWWRGLLKGRGTGAIPCDLPPIGARRYFMGTLRDALAPDFRLQEVHQRWAPIRVLAFERAT